MTLIDKEKEPITHSCFRGRLEVMVWEIVLGKHFSSQPGDEVSSIPRHVGWVNHWKVCESVKIWLHCPLTSICFPSSFIAVWGYSYLRASLEIDIRYSHRSTDMNLMVTTTQKPVTDTQKIERERSTSIPLFWIFLKLGLFRNVLYTFALC